MHCKKIPDPIFLSDCDGDWAKYEDTIYQIFKSDMIDHRPTFNGKPVDIIHEKLYKNKERSFWHIISEGEGDLNRLPKMERCEKVGWVKPLILDKGNCEHYKLWIRYHDQSKKNRYYIWCTDIQYMVILEDRHSHYKLISAFNVMPYAVKKYQKEYDGYIKTKTPT